MSKTKVSLSKPFERHHAINFVNTLADILSEKHGVKITPIFKPEVAEVKKEQVKWQIHESQ